MNDIRIRKVTVNDIDQLQMISKRTFLEAFASGNEEKNIAQYIEKAFSAHKLLEEVKNINSEFYFAQAGSEVIGYLKLNSGDGQTELQDQSALEIERIYVLKDYHGKNVGQLLYEEAIKIARQRNAEYVWLGVWEENPRAINFYKKNGFIEFDKHIFQLGNEEQTDIMMKLQLSK
jgi:diamine N-acetyltransferase